MLSKLVIITCSVLPAFYPLGVGALPTNTTFARRNSPSSHTNGTTTALITVAVGVALALVIFCSYRIARRHSKQHRGLMNAQLPTSGHVHTRNPALRTALNYTGISERSGNSRIETWGSESRANNRSTRQPRVNRRQSQNSTKSLPVYEKEARDGEVVLVQGIERRSMVDNDDEGCSGYEGEDASSTVASAAPPYNNTDRALEVPRANLTAPGSSIGSSVSPVESLQAQSESSWSNATTAASSINDSGPGRSDNTAPVIVTTEPAGNADAPPYGDTPSYNEAVTSAQTCDITEARVSAISTGGVGTN
ncbi:unnamed protein product [Rhizoctonia solani]|uniref:Uncharacterized protein n=1 Tax=Rhizoctonia solani TaxID=456999 RepID=A0A8H2ZXV6_9AGAM|nr:unnamed protein product [Rhizoctonia solani]